MERHAFGGSDRRATPDRGAWRRGTRCGPPRRRRRHRAPAVPCTVARSKLMLNIIEVCYPDEKKTAAVK